MSGGEGGAMLLIELTASPIVVGRMFLSIVMLGRQKRGRRRVKDAP